MQRSKQYLSEDGVVGATNVTLSQSGCKKALFSNLVEYAYST